MTRSAYFALVMSPGITARFLRECIARPTCAMRKRHVDLCRLALRKKTAADYHIAATV